MKEYEIWILDGGQWMVQSTTMLAPSRRQAMKRVRKEKWYKEGCIKVVELGS